MKLFMSQGVTVKTVLRIIFNSSETFQNPRFGIPEASVIRIYANHQDTSRTKHKLCFDILRLNRRLFRQKLLRVGEWDLVNKVGLSEYIKSRIFLYQIYLIIIFEGNKFCRSIYEKCYYKLKQDGIYWNTHYTERRLLLCQLTITLCR